MYNGCTYVYTDSLQTHKVKKCYRQVCHYIWRGQPSFPIIDRKTRKIINGIKDVNDTFKCFVLIDIYGMLYQIKEK